MKKVLLSLFMAVTTIVAMAQTTNYTDNLVVIIDGASTAPQETTIIVEQNADGTYKDIVHPINSDFRKKLEEKLLCAYNTHLIETHDDGVIEFQLT